MNTIAERLVPDEPPSHEEMIALQEEIRELARFEDDLGRLIPPDPESTVVGVDVGFEENGAIAAAVAVRDGAVIDRSTVRRLVRYPYVPGFLAFREAGVVIRALDQLEVTPDVMLCDGNGRLHPREAGLATHLGVAIDCPTVGVAKRLLCGTLLVPADDPMAEGTRVPIVAGEDMDVAPGTTVGYAVQTRQWEDREHAINPVYVSAGHRVAGETAADIVLATCAGYKLPEPIRLADRLTKERASAADTATR